MIIDCNLDLLQLVELSRSVNLDGHVKKLRSLTVYSILKLSSTKISQQKFRKFEISRKILIKFRENQEFYELKCYLNNDKYPEA